MKLNGKKILFIAPVFFGYEEKIAEKMIELGGAVDFFDERSIKSSFERALLKINPQIFHKKTMAYYNQIIDKISDIEYDFIFVIKCEMMPVEIIMQLKSKFSKATFCLYLYDSLDNIKGITTKLDYFDRVLSFDMEDTSRHSKMIFRPLFFIDDFRMNTLLQKNYKYDLSFIGTVHSDRYRVIHLIKKMSNEGQYNNYFYCYLQSKFMYYYYKITKKEFRGSKKRDFKFDKISSTQIAEIISNSRAVLDVQHPKQTGLTMRTIEMIGMNKKLITTNSGIKQYDFYNSENIAVISRDNVVIPKDFLNKPYQQISYEIYNKYYIESWIFEVLGLENTAHEK